MNPGSGEVGKWLEPRLGGAPPELAEAVRRLVREQADDPRTSGLDVPDVLATAALRGLDGVLAQEEPAREAALQLLAADASLTYAFEAAASIGADVEALALRIGPSGELGQRLADENSASGEMP